MQEKELFNKKNEEQKEEISLNFRGSENKFLKSDALIYVYNPEIVEGLKSYVRYSVGGKLLHQTVLRRFSDFFSLRQKLVERWPGIYIPNIPPKKYYGNLDKKNIEMRMRVLNGFCLRISKFKSIIESEEMKVFLMSSVEASKAVDNLPQLAYEEILNRYQKAFPGCDENFDLGKGKEKLKTFFSFFKKAFLNLTNFKDVVEQTMLKKDQEIENYLTLIHVFEDYEKYTLMEYTDNDESKLVFFNPKNTELCEKILKLRQNLKNPYEELFDWLEDEILDFEAMNESLTSLDALNEDVEKINSMLQKIDYDLNSLNSGYSKLKLLFTFKSNDTAKAELEQLKESNVSSLGFLKEIIKIATFFMSGYVESFKTRKLERYHSNLEKFASLQKENNESIKDLWECVSKDKNLLMKVEQN